MFQEQVGYGGDFVYDKAVGDEIKWKEGKNLTVQTEIKKQRNKSKLAPDLSRKGQAN
jgi:nucleosome assembly protein 1-like 1